MNRWGALHSPADLGQRAGALVRPREAEVQACGQAIQRAPVELSQALQRLRGRLLCLQAGLTPVVTCAGALSCVPLAAATGFTASMPPSLHYYMYLLEMATKPYCCNKDKMSVTRQQCA